MSLVLYSMLLFIVMNAACAQCSSNGRPLHNLSYMVGGQAICNYFSRNSRQLFLTVLQNLITFNIA